MVKNQRLIDVDDREELGMWAQLGTNNQSKAITYLLADLVRERSADVLVCPGRSERY